MGASVRIAIFALLSVISTHCLADVDGCTEMTKENSERALPPIRRAFEDAQRFPMDRVDVSRGRDCGGSVYFVFEAKPAFRNFGSHWIVSMDKTSGKIDIQDGI